MTDIPTLDLSSLQASTGEDLTAPSVLGYAANSWVQALQATGPITQIQLDGENYVAIASSEANREAWRTPENWCYSDTDFATIFRTQLGDDHVTILDGEPHRRLRKLILPAFGAAALRRDITTTAEIFANGLAELAGKSFDLHPAACFVMAQALNQTQIKAATSTALLRHLCQFEDEFIAGLQLNTTQQAQWFQRPAYQAERTAAFNFFNHILDERRAGTRADDSLDLILNRPVPDHFAQLSHSELIESIYLLSIAGVGNIANFLCALIWKVVGTSWHSRVQQELSGADLSTLEGMKHFPVLKALINETERLYPPAPVVPKRATRDINFLGHIIAKDTVILHLHTLPHYDEQEYPAPFEFRPERWLTETPNKTNAFGGGKHLCLGMGVTRAFLPLMTAMLLRDYTLETQDPPHNRIIDSTFAQSPVTTSMPVTLQKHQTPGYS